MKNLIKSIIFLTIFIILLHVCSNIFELKGNGFGSDVISFYNLKKNSLDIIFFGSSHSYASFSPDVIEEETNLKSYNFATQQQPIYITYHYMIEALKSQRPKYFVLETLMTSIDDEYATEGVNRDALDKMKLSKNKIDAINVSVQDKEDRISYYLNIIKYHTRYNELNKADFEIGITQIGFNNKGFTSLPQNYDIMIDNSEIIDIENTSEISAKNLEYLEKIIELCNKYNIILILVKTPSQLTEEKQMKFNWVEQYAEANNIEYLDYNKQIELLNLEFGDFYDSGHLSYTGADKISRSFSEYINNIEK